MEVQQSPNNHVYILRIWREGEDGPWRAMVQNVQEQSKIGFPTLDELKAYLTDVISALNEGASHRKPSIPSDDPTLAPVQQKPLLQRSSDG